MADPLVKSTMAVIEEIVDRAAKCVGRQPDLEARRDTIREAIAEAMEVAKRSADRAKRVEEVARHG